MSIMGCHTMDKEWSTTFTLPCLVLETLPMKHVCRLYGIWKCFHTFVSHVGIGLGVDRTYT